MVDGVTRAPEVGASRATGRDHAVVVGASMAGLLAARVLADHFARVTVVERDRPPADPSPRGGVPQGHHVHVLLMRGKQLLEGFFPGLDTELAEAGAPRMDMIAEFPILGIGGWSCRFPSPYVARACSRPLLEGVVRRRLATLPHVHPLDGHVVTGLAAEGARVTGVRVRARGDAGAREGTLWADLVVDASGRDSRAPEWLATLGYERPRETIINAFLGYASRLYEPPAGGLGPHWKGLLLNAKAPGNPRGGVIFPLEQGRWIVTLTGAARDYPPTDDAGFLAFARSLRSPLLYEAIVDARPLTPVSGYRRTENRLRHYERLRRWPRGFVALGDAVCAFNPVYGQGMTAAALAAATLDRALRDDNGHREMTVGPAAGAHDHNHTARRFQRALARANAAPWLMATGEDARWPATEGGRRTVATRLAHRYLDHILVLTTRSSRANIAFVEAAHLLKSPASLFTPSLVAQVATRRIIAGRP